MGISKQTSYKWKKKYDGLRIKVVSGKVKPEEEKRRRTPRSVPKEFVTLHC